MTATADTDFAALFEAAPISLWLEDYSALLELFSRWRADGVRDLQLYLRADEARLSACVACLRVIRVNQSTLNLLGASSQDELISSLPRIFRDDMHHALRYELQQIWDGVTEFTSQSVNYTLLGERLDVLVQVRVLPGHEARWDRVMVALQDMTERTRAQALLQRSEQHARSLFELSPVSLWVEDFSGVRQLMDEVRLSGISDFRTFLNVHSDFVERCIEKIRVLDVNQHTLSMFSALAKDDLLGRLDEVFRDEMHRSFAEQLLDLWNGRLQQVREVVNYNLKGELLNIHMQFSVMPGFEADWSRVLVSLVDITARKKAEAYLEYLGKHDSLTRLRNRAFYVEELNRITRRGPWPLSILALDLNGLKAVNDTQGHAAGDALLRRAGEVMIKSAEGHPLWCIARTGGDEFVALLPGTDERGAQQLADRIESLVELNNQFYPGQKLSLSMGHATCSNPSEVEATVNRADQLMYAAKKKFYDLSGTDRRH